MHIWNTTYLSPQSCNQTVIKGKSDLSIDEQKELIELKKCDTEVRAHEAAHKSAGGQYAGAASFEYQAGPDGKQYAVGGEVSIDTSAIPGKPQATIQKMQVVRRAALAPANPSGQDRRVAAAAAATEARAREELIKEDSSKNEFYTSNGKIGAENHGVIDLLV